MKKMALILAVTAVLLTSVAAMAHGRHGRFHDYCGGPRDYGYPCSNAFAQRGPNFDGRGPNFERRGPNFDGRRPNFDGRGPNFDGRGPKFDGRGQPLYQNMPQNIRDKMDEARRVMTELRIEMGKTPLNKVKLRSLHEQSEKLRKDISDWHFTQWLNNPNPNPQPVKPAP